MEAETLALRVIEAVLALTAQDRIAAGTADATPAMLDRQPGRVLYWKEPAPESCADELSKRSVAHASTSSDL